jgi:hypothetical protein
LIYTSTNSGVTWTQASAPNAYWGSVASSADGTKLVAAMDCDGNYNPGPIYTSIDAGVTWAQTSAPDTDWIAVASSADGTKLIAAGGDLSFGDPSPVYISVDSGATWVQASLPSAYWASVASSADGAELVAAASMDINGNALPIYISVDSGATWVQASLPSANWASVASSADGTRLVAADGSYGGIYTGSSIPTPPTIASPPASQTAYTSQTVTFTVVAGGTPPFSYQWLFNGATLSGATNSVLVLTNVQLNQAGSYAVQVSNAYGLTNSAAVLLTVDLPVCVAPPSGLVSWWRGEGNVLDSAGGNNGTLAGNATYGLGEVGQGFVLNGNGAAIQVGNPANLQLQNFTIEAWVQRASATVTSHSGGEGMLFAYGNGGYGLYLDGNGHPTLTQVGVNNVTVSAAITDTLFHHVAVTKSGSVVVFYIDGVAYPAAAYNQTFTFTTPAAIGALGDSLGDSFCGTIDEMSIYNRELSRRRFKRSTTPALPVNARALRRLSLCSQRT